MTLLHDLLRPIVLKLKIMYLFKLWIYGFKVTNHEPYVQEEVFHDSSYLFECFESFSHQEISVEIVMSSEELIDFPSSFILVRTHVFKGFDFLSVGF